MEAALSAERQKNNDERTALTRAHTEINRLKKELQEQKDRCERETHNDQYYQVKVGDSSHFFSKISCFTMYDEELSAFSNL